MTHRRFRTVSLSVIVGLLVFGATSSPTLAAAPRIIVVTGGNLAGPVVIDDWQQNLALMLAASDPVDPAKEGLQTRTSYRLAMFWGAHWDDYIKAGNDPSSLRFEQAEQRGRYYPPTAHHSAVLTLDSSDSPTRRVDSKGVAIFSSHGIRLDAQHRSKEIGTAPLLTTTLVAVLVLLAVAVGVAWAALSLFGYLRSRRRARR